MRQPCDRFLACLLGSVLVAAAISAPLGADGSGIPGESEPLETMFWTEQSGNGVIKVANRDGTDVTTVVTAVNGAADLALDLTNGKIYWTAFAFISPGVIERANLNGSAREVIVAGINPFGVALDVAAGKLYWTEFTFSSAPGAIYRSNLDGSAIEFLLPSAKPREIKLDVASQKMYWLENTVQGNSGPGKILRATLDGDDVEELVVVPGVPANLGGLALDLDAGKMYWGESLPVDRIRRANLDGSDVEDLILFPGILTASGIDVDPREGKMYWTFYDFVDGPSKIQRADLDGSDIEDLVTSGIGQPVGIALGPEGDFSPPDVPAASGAGALVLLALMGLARGVASRRGRLTNRMVAPSRRSPRAATREPRSGTD